VETYTAKQRFFHKGQLVKPGDKLELNYAEAARYSFVGYIERDTQPKPKRVLQRKKHARFTH